MVCLIFCLRFGSGDKCWPLHCVLGRYKLSWVSNFHLLTCSWVLNFHLVALFHGGICVWFCFWCLMRYIVYMVFLSSIEIASTSNGTVHLVCGSLRFQTSALVYIFFIKTASKQPLFKARWIFANLGSFLVHLTVRSRS
ncbi:hypothetical protein KC19_VG286500 [Ceratodon purpureus]|uniref:Uncharacterized protein n=1 Tax=Ceratodon purpureus TaxID=3225 RepID=A0A8T0HUR9_CERPU|nr:hypothetical protein KC19_VG286500 [Ceratodon purpureus]